MRVTRRTYRIAAIPGDGIGQEVLPEGLRALLAITFAGGGGPAATGILLGVLFIAAGVGRIYVQTRGH